MPWSEELVWWYGSCCRLNQLHHPLVIAAVVSLTARDDTVLPARRVSLYQCPISTRICYCCLSRSHGCLQHRLIHIAGWYSRLGESARTTNRDESCECRTVRADSQHETTMIRNCKAHGALHALMYRSECEVLVLLLTTSRY